MSPNKQQIHLKHFINAVAVAVARQCSSLHRCVRLFYLRCQSTFSWWRVHKNARSILWLFFASLILIAFVFFCSFTMRSQAAHSLGYLFTLQSDIVFLHHNYSGLMNNLDSSHRWRRCCHFSWALNCLHFLRFHYIFRIRLQIHFHIFIPDATHLEIQSRKIMTNHTIGGDVSPLCFFLEGFLCFRFRFVWRFFCVSNIFTAIIPEFCHP